MFSSLKWLLPSSNASCIEPRRKRLSRLMCSIFESFFSSSTLPPRLTFDSTRISRARMQTALGLVKACPAAAARVFAWFDRARAVQATDAWIVLVVQRIIRHVMLLNVAPNLPLGPTHKWIDLHQVELAIPFKNLRVGTGRSLFAADASNPPVVLLEYICQRPHLADVAALVRIPSPQSFPVLLCLLFQCDGRQHLAQIRDSVLFHSAIAQVIGFLEQDIRIEVKHVRLFVDVHQHIEKNHVFRAE